MGKLEMQIRSAYPGNNLSQEYYIAIDLLVCMLRYWVFVKLENQDLHSKV